MESLESNNSTGTEPAAVSVFSGPMDPRGMVSGVLNAMVHELETGS